MAAATIFTIFIAISVNFIEGSCPFGFFCDGDLEVPDNPPQAKPQTGLPPSKFKPMYPPKRESSTTTTTTTTSGIFQYFDILQALFYVGDFLLFEFYAASPLTLIKIFIEKRAPQKAWLFTAFKIAALFYPGWTLLPYIRTMFEPAVVTVSTGSAILLLLDHFFPRFRERLAAVGLHLHLHEGPYLLK